MYSIILIVASWDRTNSNNEIDLYTYVGIRGETRGSAVTRCHDRWDTFALPPSGFFGFSITVKTKIGEYAGTYAYFLARPCTRLKDLTNHNINNLIDKN